MNPYYSGAGVGTHYVDVWVGSPAQKRSLAVMTGSDFTAFPCGVSPFFVWGTSSFVILERLGGFGLACGVEMGWRGSRTLSFHHDPESDRSIHSDYRSHFGHYCW